MATKKRKSTARKSARKAPKRKITARRSVGSSTIESDARKGGFKRKKPTKPAHKTIKSLETYLRRMHEWKRDQSAAAAKYRRLQQLKKQVEKM